MKSPNLSITHKDLIKEWHPTLNGKLSPINYTYGSHKKVWWQCSKCDGEWDAYIFNRTIRGQGCPYCSGKRVSERNSLAVNNSDLLNEWDYVKNVGLNLENISYGSGKKVGWICIKCNGEWDAYIFNRTIHGHGCPYCSGNRISTRNSLSHNRPDLAKEFHVENYYG